MTATNKATLAHVTTKHFNQCRPKLSRDVFVATAPFRVCPSSWVFWLCEWSLMKAYESLRKLLTNNATIGAGTKYDPVSLF